MRNVVFIAPFPMRATMRFGTAISKLSNVRLIGIFQKAPSAEMAQSFEHIILVDNAISVDVLSKTMTQVVAAFGPIHRLLGILESLQEQLAILRERFGISGVLPHTARRFRDKAEMKDALRAAGVPCARHLKVRNVNELWRFIDRVGFPVVLKPPAGAGCRATYRVNNPQELVEAMKDIPVRPVLVEEFLTGVEHSMEAYTLNGVPLFASFSRYYPSPLEVMQNPWIQWVVLFPKEIDHPMFKQARDVGYKAIKALGLKTAMTHMEWFYRSDGTVAVGEIGARPPGAQFSKVTGRIHGMNPYLTWARLMVDDRFDGPWHRQKAAAIVFLRSQGSGKISKITGLTEAQTKMGNLVSEVKLPVVGLPKSSSYEGDGYVIIEHNDTNIVRQAALDLITTVKVS